jgi:hypothetical protein
MTSMLSSGVIQHQKSKLNERIVWKKKMKVCIFFAKRDTMGLIWLFFIQFTERIKTRGFSRLLELLWIENCRLWKTTRSENIKLMTWRSGHEIHWTYRFKLPYLIFEIKRQLGSYSYSIHRIVSINSMIKETKITFSDDPVEIQLDRPSKYRMRKPVFKASIPTQNPSQKKPPIILCLKTKKWWLSPIK